MYIFNLIIEYIFLKLFVKEKFYFFKMEGVDDIQMESEEKILLDTKTNEENNGESSAQKGSEVNGDSDKDDVESKSKPKKVKDPNNSDESDDDEKIEKNSLDKSFDLSSDEDDELEEQEGAKENNQECLYLGKMVPAAWFN